MHALRRVWGPSWGRRARTAGLAFSLVLGTLAFLWIMGSHVPIGKWLFWRYARVIVVSAGWALSCLTAGHRLLKLLWSRTLPILEHVTLSFAAGVLFFFLAMFVGGLFALYGPTFAVLLPWVLFASSARSFIRYARRVVRHVRYARTKPRPPAPLWALPITVFGLAGIAMLYFLILSPDNVGYDARWYHLGLAEQYAAQGAIRASPEGWYFAALPHLASFLYSWTLQLPGLDFFDHIELVAHLELMVFLFTLAGIPVLVRAVVSPVRPHLAWAAIFLFPGILLYDATLIACADHIAAMWAVPICITMRRALRDLEPRRAALFAAMLSGAALTKYQCIALIAGPLLGSSARLLWLAWQGARGRFGPRSRLWQSPLTAIGTAVSLTAPHWLKNWIFYGDPFYPTLHKYLHVHPWNPDSSPRFDSSLSTRLAWPPHGTFGQKLHETLVEGVFGFSFKVHDWPFHGDIPIFGSLFTLLVLALPFLRGSRRAALLFACGHVGIFTWYWMSHEDRYLQAQLPWMASAVAAALILIWQSGVLIRLVCAPLVAAQVIWGGDAYFFPTHAMVGQSQIKAPIDLLSARYRKDERVFSPYGVWSDLRRRLPKGAKVLVHQHHIHFGLGTMSVNDSEFFEGGISYGRLGNPQAVYDLLKGYGVTHLMWVSSWQSEDSLAGDLVFWQFAKQYVVGATPLADGVTLAPMPTTRPGGVASDRVVVRVCGGAGVYADGLYPISDLTLVDHVHDLAAAPTPEVRFDAVHDGAAQALARAQFAIVRPGCDPTITSALSSSFQSIGSRADLQYWSRPAR